MLILLLFDIFLFRYFYVSTFVCFDIFMLRHFKLSTFLAFDVFTFDVFTFDIIRGILLLPVAMDRRPAWREVPPLNYLSPPYTVTSHKGRCISHIIIMHRPADPRQTVVSDLSNVILWLVAPRFEHSTLLVRAKQYKHSAIAADLHVKEKNMLISTVKRRYGQMLDWLVERFCRIIIFFILEFFHYFMVPTLKYSWYNKDVFRTLITIKSDLKIHFSNHIINHFLYKFWKKIYYTFDEIIL